MKTVVLLTGSELRHAFVKRFLARAGKFRLLKCFCESQDNNLSHQVQRDQDNELRRRHLAMREVSERDFFELFCEFTSDDVPAANIKRGDVNSEVVVSEIIALNPDIIIAYGSSIIRPPLIERFKGRFINVHLGLSPYYRGSGTNYWPFVNDKLSAVGVTFMYIDAGVDTGEVFHQLRARIFPGDDVHKIGNRLIADFARLLPMIIERFDELKPLRQIDKSGSDRYYRNADFSEQSLVTLYENFSNGMVERHLENKPKEDEKFPILENPALL